MGLVGRIFFFIVGFFISVEVQALCVKVSRANLRSGPGSNYRITWTVGRYTPLKRLGKKGSWIRVADVDNSRHWIHRSLVERSTKCVTVSVKSANLRVGPGVNFPKAGLATVDKYTSFRTIGGEDGYIHVQDEFGGRYFVSLKIVWRPSSYRHLRL